MSAPLRSDEPSMNAQEVLRQAAGRKLVDVDGEEETVRLQPQASPGRIAEIERELGSLDGWFVRSAPRPDR
jgi:hypothetical protein